MTFANRGRVWASIALILMVAGTLSAGPISMEGRTVLCRVEGGKAVSSDVRAIDTTGGGLSVAFDVPASALKGDVLFAALVDAPLDGPAPKLFLNAAPVDIDALRRSDGWIVRLPAARLQPGRNTLAVKTIHGKTLAADGIEVFSLLDTFEEEHFGRAFADPSPQLLAQPAQDPEQLKIDVEHYDLAITLNTASTVIAGTLTCSGRVVSGPLTEVVLDFNSNSGQLAVSAVDDGNAANPLAYTVATATNRVRITLASTLATSDTFTVRVAYGGTPLPGGTFGSSYAVSTHGSPAVPVVYTFSEPYGARRWWPCKDVPNDKATIDLRITAPSAYTVVSNGTLVSKTDAGAGMDLYHFSEAYPVATYLVSICCSNYTPVSGTYTALDGETTMNVVHYLYPENVGVEGNAAPGTIEAMEYFARTFGEYPFLTEKYVTASHNSGSGMEHQTCTSLPGGDLTAGGLARRNIHELAHMWFGDLVTMDHFDHLWLNEGFATYCEALFYEQKYGKAYYHDYVNGWITTGISTTTPLVSSNADNFSGSVVYRRGGFVLHMLRHVVGDEAFFKAVRRFLEAHPYGTALTPDLQSAFEAEYGSGLDWFFQEWVYTAARLTYTWSWQIGESDGKTVLNVTINQTQEGSAFKMPIDIRVYDINGNGTTFVIWNDQKSQTIPIETGDLIVDRVEFDPDNFILKRITNPTAAAMPTLLRVESTGDGAGAHLVWASGSETPDGYQVMMSDNLTTWSIIATPDELTGIATEYTASGLTPGTDYYFRLRAIVAAGQPSAFTDTYGCRNNGDGTRVLIVDGYDRWDTQGRGTSHPWAASHGVSVAAFGANFDTVANEVIESGSVNPANYAALLWLTGEESTGHETLSTAEQAVARVYLQGGGNLFVSGSEIGWDLDNSGEVADRAFFNDYLKAAYAADDSNDYSVFGVDGGIFAGLQFTYDNGAAGIYLTGYPDVLTPLNGGVATLNYDAAQVAGVQFEGTFPSGTATGRMVYFGFPFETLYPAASRDQAMARILAFFHVDSDRPSYNSFLVY